jgi:serine/threonine-protein kinase
VNQIGIIAGTSPGDVLAGKYRIDRVLGLGGMGVVVAAHHLELDEKVAIKFLLPEMLANEEAVSRFAREARAAVKIKNEHVARVLDVGRLDEAGAPYIVMEFLEGRDLRTWLLEDGALAVEQAVEFVLHACEAIAEAHGLHIVHRDLKPANLFVVQRADGVLSVKVLDFGISKMSDPAGQLADLSVTKTASIVGSPLYMSPEQLQSSRAVDSRTDIWALGIILYELVAGRAPFMGETLPDVCVKIATQPPPPLRSLRPGIPVEIERIIFRCLEKDRNKRYATVAELASALVDYAPKRARSSAERILRTVQNAALSASVIPVPTTFTPFGASTITRTWASWAAAIGPAARRHHRGALTVSLVVLLVVAAAFALVISRRAEPTANAPTLWVEPATSGPPSTGETRIEPTVTEGQTHADMPAVSANDMPSPPAMASSVANAKPEDSVAPLDAKLRTAIAPSNRRASPSASSSSWSALTRTPPAAPTRTPPSSPVRPPKNSVYDGRK